MRRFLNSLVEYPVRLWNTTLDGWNRFFFTPADPTALGLIRLGVGALLFWSLFVYGLDLQAFFGSDGWADPDSVRFVNRMQSPGAWSFWFLVPDAMLRPVWIGCLIVVAMFTVGLWSRVTAVLAWIIVVSISRRVPVSLFGFDQIVSAWTLYLAFTFASGQAVSLDRFLARYRQARATVARRRQDGRWLVPSGLPDSSVSANLGLRLIQLHLVLIYGMAGVAKLQGPGWWSGTAIWGVLASAEFGRFDFTWLAAYPWFLNFLTHAALAFELSYPILIWVPVLRPLVIFTAVVMHVGIAISAPGLTEFGMVMFAGNLAFASGPWLRSLVGGGAASQPAGRVLYDGACPRCRASMALLAAGDPDRVLEPIDLTAVDVTTVHPSLTKGACMKAMHLVRADGRVDVGYDAVVTLGRWIPLFWPLGLIGSLPILSWGGHRAYNAIAASRPRDVVCTDDACGIHPPSSVA